ncbi:helicase-related protein [Lysinibacillus sp. JNUCC-52]|uniref:helicase-related protein n=1 Tax=Lysinibacillus sp. JNUCC-52 TaxID=2792480 RepID=UPI001935AED0|nr:ATP-dependent DNA helicase RecQ [Lysinibacillus sp. JNUCC-52]
MNYEKYILEYITNIDVTEEKIFFFKGFPKEFYDQLIQHNEFPRFTDCSIDYVFQKGMEVKPLVVSLMMYNRQVSWGTYEELIAISQTINDISTIYKGKIEIINNNLYQGYYESYSSSLVEILDNISIENEETVYDLYYSDYKMFNSSILVEYILKHEENELGLPITEKNFFTKEIILVDIPSEEVSKITENEINQIVYTCLTGEYDNVDFIVNTLPSNDETLFKRLNILNELFQNSTIRFYSGKSAKKIKRPIEEHLSYFKKHWGEDKEYRNALFYKDPDLSLETININQGDIISDVLVQCENSRNVKDGIFKSSDIIITAPTGAGKSLFFQVPGIVLHEKYKEVTIVVTPLQALMRDQVEKLNIERKIPFATFINSEISFDERRSRIDGIKNGEYSIVYLSPELLLSSSIEDLIGERRIGLFVVDEAHLVTSWGRDFRVDYWFLGDYLDKIRNAGYYLDKSKKRKFPILILTATAIYGGEDDEIGELIESLHLNIDQSDHMYLGYGRKDNISFNIVPHSANKSEKEQKNKFVLNRIKDFINKREKTIIYCPYTKQVDEIYNLFYAKDEHLASYLGIYHGKLAPHDKEETYRKFKSNQLVVMIATKAFGMGIDIDDVSNVYHYAPTGTLADYVQEIGRAARQLDKGYAIMDFITGKDMKYAKTLWGLGGIKQYQVKEIANVLYKTYKKNKKRNLLISPESFSHIFDSNEVDAKVKSGLMLLTNDLLNKFHFKAITIRPKAMYTTQYISVNNSIEEEFLKQYGNYISLIDVNKCRQESGFGTREDLQITLLGNIYEIDLGRLWEEKFDNLTFPQFKYKFFNNELFVFNERIIPKMKLVIDYSENGYDNVLSDFLNIASKIQNTFLSIAREYNKKEFSFKDFYDRFSSLFEEKDKPKQEFVRILLDMFCFEGIALDSSGQSIWKFVQKRKKENNLEVNYKLVTNKYNYVHSNLKRFIGDATPNQGENEHIVYINIPEKGHENRDFKILLASILQLFNLASFEIQGGKNAQIFVRINDPLKLYQILNAKSYTNNILHGITQKHDKSINFMNKFLGVNFEDRERWDIIEHYFLGRNDWVNQKLNQFSPKEIHSKPTQLKIKEMGENTIEYYEKWDDLEYGQIFKSLSIPLPDFLGTVITIENNDYNLEYFWRDLNIGIVSSAKKIPEKNIGLTFMRLLNFDEIDSTSLSKLFGSE